LERGLGSGLIYRSDLMRKPCHYPQWVAWARAEKADIQAALGQFVDLPRRGQLPDTDVDHWVVSPEGRHGRGQHAGKGCRDDVADLDPAQFTTPSAPPNQLGPLRLAQGPPRLLEDERPCVGKGDYRPLAALEEPCAEMAFYGLDLGAQRRLRDAQSLGRASKVQFLGDRDEVAEVPEFHDGVVLGCPNAPVREFDLPARSKSA
jgi:hypothetical protein